MNLVLADTEEFRRVKKKQAKPSGAPGASGSSASQTIESEEKRTLGLTIVRGAHIVSLSVESAPPADPSTRLGKTTTSGLPTGLAAGPGVSRPAGRGSAPAPSSLAVRIPKKKTRFYYIGPTADNSYRAQLQVLVVLPLPSLLNLPVHLAFPGLVEVDVCIP